MSPWIQLAATVILTALGFTLVSPARWFDISTAIVPALSIIAAAVLFRLGRGLPNFEVATLPAAEVRRLATAYCIVARNTAVILVVLFLAIALGALPALWGGNPPSEPALFVPTLARTGMTVTAFAVIRTVALVLGDLALIRLQAQLLEQHIKAQHVTINKVRREHGRKTKPLSTPPGYGGLANHD